VVISGPSGTGKTTVCNEILKRVPGAVWSVSATTRPKRTGEVDGKDYYFVSREEFERMVRAGEFLEWAEYLGNLYGTPARPVREAIARGKVVVCEIDVQGGRQIAEKMPDSVRIFLLPPSRDVLEQRLRKRGTEMPEQLAKRLAQAELEVRQAREWSCYQYFVVNDDLEEAVQQVVRIIGQERQGHDRGTQG